MYTNTQVLLDNHTTARTHLRGVGGVHGHDWRTSIFSFVRQQLLELAQTRVMCAEGQVVVGGHELEREVFQGDQPIGVCQLAGELVPEVAALVGDVLMQARDLFGGFAAALAAPNRSLQPSL